MTGKKAFSCLEMVINGHLHNSLIAIGLYDESSSETTMPGWVAGWWAYHGDDGKKFGEEGRGERYREIYGTGDTICCGVDFNSNTVSYYKNGISLVRLYNPLIASIIATNFCPRDCISRGERSPVSQSSV
jgi:hypothetical protein